MRAACGSVVLSGLVQRTHDLRRRRAPGRRSNVQSRVVVAENTREIRELPVIEAVMQLDLTESSFLVFRNIGHGGLNIVYRHPDGHIGWIDTTVGAITPGNDDAASESVKN